MPLPSEPQLISIDITSILGGLLYPQALSFLIPVSVCVCVWGGGGSLVHNMTCPRASVASGKARLKPGSNRGF